MTILLAIDTSSSITRVALCSEGELKEYRTDEPRQAAQQLLPLIQTAFTEGGLSPKNLDGIVVVTGPGSFTGLRIGIGVAQGLSVANATALLGVSSLELLAKTATTTTDSDGFLVCMPAREDEIYLGVYEAEESNLSLMGTELVVELNAPSLKLNLPERNWSGIGAPWQNQHQLETLFAVSVSNIDTEAEPSMEDLCALGLEKLARGETLSSEELLPNYVKERLDYS